MVETSVNIFDAIVIGVLFLSAILSLFRGFVRELLSLGAWVGAGVITLYAFPHVAEWIMPYVKKESVANGFASMGTYVTALLTLSICNRMLLKFLKTGSEVGMMDNIFGLIFGLARGTLLVSIAYIGISAMVAKDEDKQPEWLKTSLTKPYVADAAAWISKIAPEYFEEVNLPIKEAIEKQHETETDEDILREDNDPTEEPKWPTMEDLQGAIESEDR